MEIALIIVGLIALGLGGGVFVLLKGVSGERVKAAGVGEELASVNARLDAAEGERVRLVGELGVAEGKAEESGGRVVALSVEMAEINERLSGAEKRYLDLVNDEKRMVESFELIGGKSLRANQEALSKFLTERLKDADSLSQQELDKRKVAIEQLVKPISETLGKTREQLAQLDERVRASGESNESLKDVTQKLAKALSKPEMRGRYGEIQLQRVAELAGMTSYCDFDTQSSVKDSDGKFQRPDMIVKLPNERVIVVDAKAPIDSFMKALDAQNDQERDAHLDKFAKDVGDQVKALSDKRYWDLFERTPEFVVMFVPGDHFVDAALARNENLLELAAQRNVILASPGTLIGLLRAVAVGWREYRVNEGMKELEQLGEDLLNHARFVFDHTRSLGSAIQSSVSHYNKLVGSIDSNLYRTLQKFEENGIKGKNLLEQPKGVDVETRLLLAEGVESIAETEKNDADASEV